jgi:hypothetical protein
MVVRAGAGEAVWVHGAHKARSFSTELILVAERWFRYLGTHARNRAGVLSPLLGYGYSEGSK